MTRKQPTYCVELELPWFERVSGLQGLAGRIEDLYCRIIDITTVQVCVVVATYRNHFNECGECDASRTLFNVRAQNKKANL